MAVFVSYADRDGSLLEPLTGALHRAQVQTWFDEEFSGGEMWWRSILERIRSCELFVVAFSQNFLASKVCGAQLQYAQALGKPILPILIGPVDGTRANPLAAMQIIDFRNPGLDTGIELVSSVYARRADSRPLPDPLPAGPPMPFANLTHLASTVSGPALNAREQSLVLSQLRASLDDAGADIGVQHDIIELLRVLRDRRDVTFRTRTEVDAMLASLGARSAADAAQPATSQPFGAAPSGPPPMGTSSAPPPQMATSSAPPPPMARPPYSVAAGQPAYPTPAARGERIAAARPINLSVFAPPVVQPGEMFMVQVFIHVPDEYSRVETLARSFDSAAEPRGSGGLTAPVGEGEHLSIEWCYPG